MCSKGTKFGALLDMLTDRYRKGAAVVLSPLCMCVEVYFLFGVFSISLFILFDHTVVLFNSLISGGEGEDLLAACAKTSKTSLS